MIIWINKKEKELWINYLDQQERYIMGIGSIFELKGNGSLSTNNKKWAWIEVNGERQMQWVCNVTMKAYKADGYNCTDIEIPEYKFERWCRLMDF